VPNRPGDRISQRGYCAEHGRERMLANHDALKSKRGPYARWWAYRLADGVWGMPIDEEPPRP
jgi:hypothetical protein